MSRQITLDVSPPIHRGMRDSLDRNAFQKSVPVLAARVPPVKTGLILKSAVVRKFLLNLPRVRSVVHDPSNPDGDRLVLLGISNEDELAPDARQFLIEESNGLQPYTLDLDYSYWTADEILQAILPEDICQGSPTGFAMTGHIAHVNLNDEYLPYKYIVGQVFLDKNKQIKTVVNKLDGIDNQFRVFKMELLAGEQDYVVEHHESDCRFTFDFTQVYWNSRLHTEHDRIVQLFTPDDVIVDVFAGVGPFAIPAAKKGCAVLANDLNPSSAKYLSKNVQDNRVSELVRVSCKDGRDFIRTVTGLVLENPFPPYSGPRPSRIQERKIRKLKQAADIRESSEVGLLEPTKAPRSQISHFVMNLPDTAIHFLDAFRGILSAVNNNGRDLRGVYDVMPTIHCHCFTRELETERAKRDIKMRVEEKLGHELPGDTLWHLVRSVAPNKNMYCVSFRLPAEVAFSS